MAYVKTKDGRIIESLTEIVEAYDKVPVYIYMVMNDGYKHCCNIQRDFVEKTSDTIEELLDEFVFIENGKEDNIVYLPEAKDRLDDYHNFGNYEPRLIGRIKVGLDKKAVAEWKELTEGKYKGCYDWVLL